MNTNGPRIVSTEWPTPPLHNFDERSALSCRTATEQPPLKLCPNATKSLLRMSRSIQSCAAVIRLSPARQRCEPAAYPMTSHPDSPPRVGAGALRRTSNKHPTNHILLKPSASLLTYVRWRQHHGPRPVILSPTGPKPEGSKQSRSGFLAKWFFGGLGHQGQQTTFHRQKCFC